MSKGATEPFFSIHSASADHSFLLHLPPSRVASLDRQQHGRPASPTFFFGPQKESQEGNFMLRRAPSSAPEELLGGGWRPRRGRPTRHPPAPPPLQSNANVFRQGSRVDNTAGRMLFPCRRKEIVRFKQLLLTLLQITACSRRSQASRRSIFTHTADPRRSARLSAVVLPWRHLTYSQSTCEI